MNGLVGWFGLTYPMVHSGWYVGVMRRTPASSALYFQFSIISFECSLLKEPIAGELGSL